MGVDYKNFRELQTCNVSGMSSCPRTRRLDYRLDQWDVTAGRRRDEYLRPRATALKNAFGLDGSATDSVWRFSRWASSGENGREISAADCYLIAGSRMPQH